MGMAIAVHRFTVDEFQRMGEAGVLPADARVELLDGQIVEMTPIGPAHNGCVAALIRLLGRRLPESAWLWVQSPVQLHEREAPQPDVVVLRARADAYRTAQPQPQDVELVIEVGDSSVAADRRAKLPRYARAAIPETWLVDLPGDGVELYRESRGGRYTDVHTARRGETIAPLAFPELTLSVDEILG